MTNPAPRPALRKAADADIHPAAPRPARSPRTPRTTTPPVESPAPAPEITTPATSKAKPRRSESSPRKRKFSGSTSDHMRVPDFTAEISDEAAVRNGVEKKPRRPAHNTFFGDAPQPAVEPAADVVLTVVPVPEAPAEAVAESAPAKAHKPANLMSGKTVELEVHVPKALRKAARDHAKARGLDLDTVVIDLLHAWVTGPT
jgi:hypothetical protein